MNTSKEYINKYYTPDINSNKYDIIKTIKTIKLINPNIKPIEYRMIHTTSFQKNEESKKSEKNFEFKELNQSEILAFSPTFEKFLNLLYDGFATTTTQKLCKGDFGYEWISKEARKMQFIYYYANDIELKGFLLISLHDNVYHLEYLCSSGGGYGAKLFKKFFINFNHQLQENYIMEIQPINPKVKSIYTKVKIPNYRYEQYLYYGNEEFIKKYLGLHDIKTTYPNYIPFTETLQKGGKNQKIFKKIKKDFYNNISIKNIAIKNNLTNYNVNKIIKENELKRIK